MSLSEAKSVQNENMICKTVAWVLYAKNMTHTVEKISSICFNSMRHVFQLKCPEYTSAKQFSVCPLFAALLAIR